MTDAAEGRRRVRRRRIAGGGVSDSSISEGGSIADGLNRQVESMAVAPPSPVSLTETESNVGSRTEAPQDFTPQNRMAEVRSRASQYEKEYRLKLVHRMLMRNVPLDQIARELEVSIHTVMRDRKELYSRLKEEAKKLDINKLIGDTMGFYQEVQGMGLRAASVTKLPMNMRLAAMRTALASKNDLHRFLNHVGVYDVLRYRAGTEGGDTDIEKVMKLTESLLAGEDGDLQSIAEMEALQELQEEELHLLG
jgi:hypothetical protein